jgi:hypothetical protein
LGFEIERERERERERVEGGQEREVYGFIWEKMGRFLIS